MASVQSSYSELSKSLSSLSAKRASLDSVASILSKSSESEASAKHKTPTIEDFPENTSGIGGGNGNNNNVALVGGVVGGVLGSALLGLIVFFLMRRCKRVAPPSSAGQRPFVVQQPSSQFITPASPTFSTNSNYLGGPPVAHAVQSRFQSQQSSLLALPGATSPTAGRASIASQQSGSPPPAVKMWIESSPNIHQEAYGGTAPQPRSLPSAPPEGQVNPRDLYNDGLRGSTYSAAPPMNVPSSASGTWSPPSHAPPYSPAFSKQDPDKFGG